MAGMGAFALEIRIRRNSAVAEQNSGAVSFRAIWDEALLTHYDATGHERQERLAR